MLSCGWVYLCDAAPYKPLFVEDTSDFYYFFDCSGILLAGKKDIRERGREEERVKERRDRGKGEEGVSE